MAAPFLISFVPYWCGSIYLDAQQLKKYQDFSKNFQNRLKTAKNHVIKLLESILDPIEDPAGKVSDALDAAGKSR